MASAPARSSLPTPLAFGANVAPLPRGAARSQMFEAEPESLPHAPFAPRFVGSGPFSPLEGPPPNLFRAPEGSQPPPVAGDPLYGDVANPLASKLAFAKRASCLVLAVSLWVVGSLVGVTFMGRLGASKASGGPATLSMIAHASAPQAVTPPVQAPLPVASATPSSLPAEPASSTVLALPTEAPRPAPPEKKTKKAGPAKAAPGRDVTPKPPSRTPAGPKKVKATNRRP